LENTKGVSSGLCVWEDDTTYTDVTETANCSRRYELVSNVLTVITLRNTHRTCGMRGNNEKFIKYFNVKPEQNHHLEHPNVDDKII
jgi:hypothetical protein